MTELNLDPRKVAIERNREIVPRSAYTTTPIMDGDAIEVVGFIGGDSGEGGEQRRASHIE